MFSQTTLELHHSHQERCNFVRIIVFTVKFLDQIYFNTLGPIYHPEEEKSIFSSIFSCERIMLLFSYMYSLNTPLYYFQNLKHSPVILRHEFHFQFCRFSPNPSGPAACSKVERIQRVPPGAIS